MERPCNSILTMHSLIWAILELIIYICHQIKNRLLRHNISLDPVDQLPNDIIQLIYLRLDLASRCRFPAVCRSWRRTTASVLAPPSGREPPWIIFLLYKNCILHPKYRLLDVSCNFSRNLRVPKLEGFCIVYGSHGSFLTVGSGVQRGLHNPFSGEYIPLPLSDHEDPYEPYEEEETSTTSVGEVIIHNAALSCDPTPANRAAGQCLAALEGRRAGLGPADQSAVLYLCRPGIDTEWKTLEIANHNDFWSMTFYRGALYEIDLYGKKMKLVSIDWANQLGERIYKVIYTDSASLAADPGRTSYLMESEGDLLLVRGNISSGQKEVYFTVFRVLEEERDEETMVQKMVKVEELGERMLFVGRRCSMSWSSAQIIVSQTYSDANNHHFFKGNCIYFFFHQAANVDQYYGVGRFDLKKGVCDAVLDHPYLECAGYPQWITPFLS